MDISGFTKIARTKIIEGCYVPAIIDNMSNFFTRLEVYGDGLIDCWELVDLDLFKAKLESEKVKTFVPDGESISIHHLGEWQVNSGKWLFDKNSFYKYVLDVLKILNPDMTNLHNCHGKTTKKVDNFSISILGSAHGKPFTMDGPDYFGRRIRGDSLYVFVRTQCKTYRLANLCVFANSMISISGIDTPIHLTIDKLREKVKSKEIVTELPKEANVDIYGLGSFIAGKCHYAMDIDQIILEVEDMLLNLQNKKTSSEICRELYEKYCETPTKGLKAELKEAYERIPEHLRIYVLGDQDRKDIPVRMIIYGESEIKNWSHYMIAEKYGEELPTIDIPKNTE